MNVRDNWSDWIQENGKNTHIGICWSYDVSGADNYSGEDRVEHSMYGNEFIIIKSVIDRDYVDWETTFSLMSNISLYQDEKEIRLFKGTPLELISLVNSNGDEIDDSISGTIVRT